MVQSTDWITIVCFDRMREFKEQGRVVFCTRMVVLN